MMQFTNLLGCICFAGFVYGSESPIIWNVLNKSIKIGDEAILNCNANACSQNMTKTWYGGRNYELLCYNEVSTYPTKYAMKSYKTSYDFSLIIKQFNFKDINYAYTCACGFNRYTQMLKLEDFDFVYGDVHYLSKIKDDRFIVEVVMKVYPIPTCFFVYKAKEYGTSVHILELDNSSEEVSEPYTVTIHASLNVEPSDSKGFINLTCQAKSTYHNVLDININEEYKDVGNVRVLYTRETWTFIWFGLVFLIIVILTVLIFLILK